VKEWQNQQKQRFPSAVGSSTTKKCVVPVQTVRTVDVFVSRLHPYTTAAELKECVDCVKDDVAI